MAILSPEDVGWLLDEYDSEEFWSKVHANGGTEHMNDPLATAAGECWTYDSATGTNGYSRAWIQGRDAFAHRVAFRDAGGKIPEGYDLDHLCRNRACVNPAHLEPVSRAVNIARGLVPLVNRGKCKNGHAVTEENVMIDKRGHSACLACKKDRGERSYLKN